MPHNAFNTLKSFQPSAGKSGQYYSLPELAKTFPNVKRLPFSIRVVLESPRGRYAIEIKRSLSPAPSKGLAQGASDISAVRRYIVYPGDTRFPCDAATEAVPMTSLMAELGGW